MVGLQGEPFQGYFRVDFFRLEAETGFKGRCGARCGYSERFPAVLRGESWPAGLTWRLIEIRKIKKIAKKTTKNAMGGSPFDRIAMRPSPADVSPIRSKLTSRRKRDRLRSSHSRYRSRKKYTTNIGVDKKKGPSRVWPSDGRRPNSGKNSVNVQQNSVNFAETWFTLPKTG